MSSAVCTGTNVAVAGGVSAVGPDDQDDLRAPPLGRGGQRVAHAARRAIGDVAHGIDRLTRRPRGDQHALAGQVTRGGERAQQRLDQGVDLGQPAPGVQAGGERAGVGIDHRHAARAQRGDVGRHRGMLPHAAVHRRRHHHRAAGGQQQRGEEIVGDAVRGLGQEVRGGRRHDDGGGALGERDVLDRGLALGIEEIGQHRPAGERAEGERAHELLRVLSQAHGDRGAEPRELAQQVDRLVGGDGARDAEDQLSAAERGAHALVVSPSSFTRYSTLAEAISSSATLVGFL